MRSAAQAGAPTSRPRALPAPDRTRPTAARSDPGIATVRTITLDAAADHFADRLAENARVAEVRSSSSRCFKVQPTPGRRTPSGESRPVNRSVRSPSTAGTRRCARIARGSDPSGLTASRVRAARCGESATTRGYVRTQALEAQVRRRARCGPSTRSHSGGADRTARTRAAPAASRRPSGGPAPARPRACRSSESELPPGTRPRTGTTDRSRRDGRSCPRWCGCRASSRACAAAGPRRATRSRTRLPRHVRFRQTRRLRHRRPPGEPVCLEQVDCTVRPAAEPVARLPGVVSGSICVRMNSARRRRPGRPSRRARRRTPAGPCGPPGSRRRRGAGRRGCRTFR